MQQLKKARLLLEDGTIYEGTSFGYEKSVSGEVVFYTAMTGYPESLTDPSYAGQILVPTYPMIGNYGVPVDDERDGISKFFESDRIHCKALVISDYSSRYSHWNSQKSLGDWLKEQQIPGEQPPRLLSPARTNVGHRRGLGHNLDHWLTNGDTQLGHGGIHTSRSSLRSAPCGFFLFYHQCTL